MMCEPCRAGPGLPARLCGTSRTTNSTGDSAMPPPSKRPGHKHPEVCRHGRCLQDALGAREAGHNCPRVRRARASVCAGQAALQEPWKKRPGQATLPRPCWTCPAVLYRPGGAGHAPAEQVADRSLPARGEVRRPDGQSRDNKGGGALEMKSSFSDPDELCVAELPRQKRV